MIIRPAREEDAAGMLAILAPLIREGRYTIMDEVPTLDEQRAYIRDFPAHGVFLVALGEDGTVLGLQDVEPASSCKALRHVGYISTFVADGVRGQGVGRRLMAATVAAAREKGFLKLSAMIRADNPRAIAFYTGQGFRVLGTAERHACVRGVFIDELLTEKHLA
jgi:L-amino acid N-acyltransferase YncA